MDRKQPIPKTKVMARAAKYHQQYSATGWPMFTATQTDNRIALCRKALCPDRSLTLKFKNCYESELVAERYCKLRFLYGEYFTEHLKKINELGWGGEYKVPKIAPEGAFYPFVRCLERHRPADVGCIWIGTKHDYPRIYVNNMVADWLCPYTKMGHILTEPFALLGDVIQNWRRLSDKRLFPSLDLPLVPDL